MGLTRRQLVQRNQVYRLETKVENASMWATTRAADKMTTVPVETHIPVIEM